MDQEKRHKRRKKNNHLISFLWFLIFISKLRLNVKKWFPPLKRATNKLLIMLSEIRITICWTKVSYFLTHWVNPLKKIQSKAPNKKLRLIVSDILINFSHNDLFEHFPHFLQNCQFVTSLKAVTQCSLFHK